MHPTRVRPPDRFELFPFGNREAVVGVCFCVADEVGRTSKGKHYQAALVKLLRERQLAWGILTNGTCWRLCHAGGPAPYEDYLEVDLDGLVSHQSLSDFALFQRFFAGAQFARLNGDLSGLDSSRVESEKRTQVIERHLKERVDGIIQALCLGFVEDERPNKYDRAKLDLVYQNSIYLLYRILFLLYAEARGLLPLATPAYRAVSLASIVEDALAYRGGTYLGEPFSMWKRLAQLFAVVDDGDAELGVRPYNGGLFSDAERPYLKAHQIADAYLAPALVDLAYIYARGRNEHIDYRDLSVRHLGTLYEGLLEYRLNLVAGRPVVVRDERGKRTYVKQSLAGPIKKGEMVLEVGQVFFADDQWERKSSGSYYTPDDVVQNIVSSTLEPKLLERRAAIDESLADIGREWDIAPSAEARVRLELYADQLLLEAVENKVLGIKILDPAMGSGHFLVAAGQAITNFVVETLNMTDWANEAINCDPVLWKRRIVERCLYGVDINPLAQELAKLALWISSASNGKPLTFLDHHLKVGSALNGAPLEYLIGGAAPNERKEKAAQEDSLLYLVAKAAITDIVEKLADTVEQDSDDIVAVKHKEESFREAEAGARRIRDIANVWLATSFGLATERGEPLRATSRQRIIDDLAVNYAPGSMGITRPV